MIDTRIGRERIGDRVAAKKSRRVLLRGGAGVGLAVAGAVAVGIGTPAGMVLRFDGVAAPAA